MTYLFESSYLVAGNFIASVVLVAVFYFFHPRKYDAILIFVVANMIGLIVRYFVEREIGVGTGFGLFAVFSLMHFKETYHTFTMVYLFVGLSFGLLSSLMPEQEFNSFLIMVLIGLVLIVAFELILRGAKKVVYTVPVSELSELPERAKKDLSARKIKEMNVQSISQNKAKVTVTYIK